MNKLRGLSHLRKERVLILSHGHPHYVSGGAEVAAYNLFKAYRGATGVEAAWFLARHNRVGGRGSVQCVGPDEYIWEQHIDDWVMLRSDLPQHVYTPVEELITTLKPTILHAHHYAHIGLDFLCYVRQLIPKLKIMMTLHEYMAICHHNGQMIRTGGRGLCTTSSPAECETCFPHIAKEHFWLRKDYVVQAFETIDRFVSPSKFLRQRYISWGIDRRKIVTIENLHAFGQPVPARSLSPRERRRVFGYFGQINPYKGIEVLLDAVDRMPDKLRKEISVCINGANLEIQPEDFQQRIKSRLSQLSQHNCVNLMGPYTRDELPDRMARMDWVVVPSTWWENSPMVIQEAFYHGRPVICAGIGGMAEKVRDGADGLHFKVGDPADLARVMQHAVTHKGLWQQLVDGIKRPPGVSEVVNLHLAACQANQKVVTNDQSELVILARSNAQQRAREAEVD